MSSLEAEFDPFNNVSVITDGNAQTKTSVCNEALLTVRKNSVFSGIRIQPLPYQASALPTDLPGLEKRLKKKTL